MGGWRYWTGGADLSNGLSPYHHQPFCSATLCNTRSKCSFHAIASYIDADSSIYPRCRMIQISKIIVPSKEGESTALTPATVLQMSWPPAPIMNPHITNVPIPSLIAIPQITFEDETIMTPSPRIARTNSTIQSIPFTEIAGAEVNDNRAMHLRIQARSSPRESLPLQDRNPPLSVTSRKWF